MKSIKELSYCDLKSIYDLLELKKSIVTENPETCDREDIHAYINKQKVVWDEMHSRMENIRELKLK